MAKKTSIGGQALIEGIMMRGPKNTAMAVRNPSGEIVLEECPTKGTDRKKFFKLPIIRGIFNMIDSLTSGYKYLMRSAEISGMDEEEERKKQERGEKWYDGVVDKLIMPIASVLAVALAVVLFFWLPMQLWNWLGKLFPGIMAHHTLRAVFEGIFRILVFIAYVWGTSKLKDIRRTYMYHGAEHKTIFCYEAGLPLTVENVRKQGRFHPRCGTSFTILVLLVSIVFSMFIHVDTVWLRMLIKLPMIPLIVGVGYELIKLAGRMDNVFTRIISAPGIALQHLTVFEPEDDMIECAIEAMNHVIPTDGSDIW
ncbi:MAG: DUF1385 domain-containing protein [Clostridia bacterium]|nr:DUF1385 domain-containing protein [Clostridia bacterium]MBQ8972715.1 DUF1385 domain-containing protein [Clostridia bacterium]